MTNTKFTIGQRTTTKKIEKIIHNNGPLCVVVKGGFLEVLPEKDEGKRKLFWELLKSGKVNELVLSGCYLSELPTKIFGDLLAAIEHIDCVDFSGNALGLLLQDPSKLELFCRFLERSKASKIDLSDNDLKELSDDHKLWEKFWAAIKIPSLNLRDNRLGKLQKNSWPPLAKAFKKLKFRPLLAMNHFASIKDDDVWRECCKATSVFTPWDLCVDGGFELRCLELNKWDILINEFLNNPQIVALNLGGTLFNLFQDPKWEKLLETLRKSQATVLDLSGCGLDKITKCQRKDIYKVIGESPLEVLFLNDVDLLALLTNELFDGWLLRRNLKQSEITSLFLENAFAEFQGGGYKRLGIFLKKSKITFLGLGHNSLSQWLKNSGTRRQFCAALEGSNVTDLDLSNNNLSQLPKEWWLEFAQLLQKTKIKNINLGDNQNGSDIKRWISECFCKNRDNQQIIVSFLPSEEFHACFKNGSRPSRLFNFFPTPHNRVKKMTFKEEPFLDSADKQVEFFYSN